jgi:hypothetical protein
MKKALFEPQNIPSYFAGLHLQIEADINRLSAEQLATVDLDVLAAQFAERYGVTCPVLGDHTSPAECRTGARTRLGATPDW